MWNYIWRRNRLLERVVVNKRWRIGVELGRQLGARQYFAGRVNADRNWNLRNLRKFL